MIAGKQGRVEKLNDSRGRGVLSLTSCIADGCYETYFSVGA